MTLPRKPRGLSFHVRQDTLPDFRPRMATRIAVIVALSFAGSLGAIHIIARILP
jgi:hypothetical protein